MAVANTQGNYVTATIAAEKKFYNTGPKYRIWL
jgi:hypothetical protein